MRTKDPMGRESSQSVPYIAEKVPAIALKNAVNSENSPTVKKLNP
jgi:hypothetical protein